MPKPSKQTREKLANYYERGKGAYLFGHPITEFTKEELIGALEMIGNDRLAMMEQHERDLDKWGDY